MARSTGPTHEEMRDRLLQGGGAELREEYARLGPRRDAIVALFQARKLRKLTQHELAQRAGVSQGVISRLESGGHSPKLETLERIARAMDFHLELTLVDTRESAAVGDTDGRHEQQDQLAEVVEAQSTGKQPDRDVWRTRRTTSEHELSRQTATAFRNRGYEVTFEEVLDFLPGFRADLVARKGDEVRVVEVKSSSVPVNIGALDQVARAIEARPGWSFELMLASGTERSEPTQGLDPLDREHVHLRLDEAEQVLDAGHAESAFLLACSAYEATNRLLLDDGQEVGERISEYRRRPDQPAFGVAISAPAMQQLLRLGEMRNAIIHGYRVPEFDAASVKELIDAVRDQSVTAV